MGQPWRLMKAMRFKGILLPLLSRKLLCSLLMMSRVLGFSFLAPPHSDLYLRDTFRPPAEGFAPLHST
jgi:hypothetical protein